MKTLKNKITTVICYGSSVDVVLGHKASPGDGQHGRGVKGGGSTNN